MHRGNAGRRSISKLVKLDGPPLTCTGAPTSPAAPRFLPPTPPPGGRRHRAPVSPALPSLRPAPQDQSGSISGTRTNPRPAERTKDHHRANAKLKHMQEKNIFRLSVRTPCSGGMHCSVTCSVAWHATAAQTSLLLTLRVKSAFTHTHENTFPSLPPSLPLTSSRPAVCTLSMFFLWIF